MSTTILANLSESEIRSIIRRRILIEELRHSEAQKIMIREAAGADGTAPISLPSEVTDVISATLSMIPGIPDGDIADLLPWMANAATALLGIGGGAIAVTMLPGGFLLKSYALAKIAMYTYALHKYIVSPAMKGMQGSINPELYFLNSSSNPVKSLIDDFATKVSNKEFKFPALPSNFGEATNNLTPESSRADYQAALDNDISMEDANVTDCFGIDLEQFNENKRATSGVGVYRDAFNERSTDEQNYKETAQEMVDEALSSNDYTKVLNVLKSNFNRRNMTLHDLHHIDTLFGKKLLDNNSVSWGGSDVLIGSADFTVTKQEFTNTLNDPDKSCIYYACQNFDTFAGRAKSNMSFGIFGGGVSADQINGIIKQELGTDELKKTKMAKLMVDQANFLDMVSPYVGGDTTRVEEHISDGGNKIFIGIGFFNSLKASIFDRLKELWDQIQKWVSEAWDQLSPQIAATATGVLAAVTDFFDTTLKPAWESIKSGDFLTATMKGLKSMWEGIVGIFNGLFDGEAEASDEDESDGSGSTRTGSSRGGRKVRPSVKKMQTLLNNYIQENGIDTDPTEADGIWGGDTDRVWEIVVNEAFKDGLFKDDPDASEFSEGLDKWPDMSEKLNDETGPQYPDYTPDHEGAYKFIRDIYRGKIDKNAKVKDNTRLGAEEEEGGGTRDTRGTNDGGGRIERNNIGIEVLAGNNSYDTLEKVGFEEGTSKNVSDAVLAAIRSMNHTGGMVTLKVQFAKESFRKYNEGDVIAIRRDETQTLPRMINYKALRKRIGTVLKSDNSKVDTSKMNRNEKGKRGTFTLVLRIPPGAKRF